jgi:hypothetical protein
VTPRDKTPLIKWEHYQTEAATEEQIREWFSRWIDANIGLVTGAISDCIVVDIDSVEARDKLKSILGDCDLQTVPRSRTGKGWQLFFKHPEVSIANRAGVLPNIDVRADGGYVVAPPSIHPNGKQYKWEVPLNGHMPELPGELFKVIQAPSNNRLGYREKFNSDQLWEGVGEGQRDHQLFQYACQLRAGNASRDVAEKLILGAATRCKPPFPEREALKKVEQAWKYQPGESKDAPQSKSEKTNPWAKAQSAPDFCAEEDKDIAGLAKDLIVPGAITCIAAP